MTNSAFTVSGAGAGGLIFLTSATASSSATLDFSQVFSSNYNSYMADITNLLPATDGATLQVLLGTGATPTWVNTGYMWSTMSNVPSNNVKGAGSNSDTSASIGLAFGTFGASNAGAGLSGNVSILGTNGTSQVMQGQSNLSFINNNSSGYTIATSGFYLPSATYTSLRFLFSAGNITSGKIVIYGIANS